MLNKNLLFISHAAPENNYLAGWLASKLRLLGYEVWVDVEDLRSGSSFWNEIELKMRNDSIRFIALVSESYVSKSRNKNSGVFSEVTLAKTLSKTIDNYILPIKVDGTSYDDFPLNILPLDTINFSTNWGSGLKKLIAELEEQKIDKGEPSNEVLSEWHSIQKIQGTVKKKKEYYGSNWFNIDYPKQIYVYKFIGEIESLYKAIPFKFVRDADYIIGFFDNSGLGFHFTHFEQINTEEFATCEEITLEDGYTINNPPQKLVRLLNLCVNEHFYNLDNFGVYQGANKKKIAYVRYNENKNGYISLKKFGKRGRKIYSTKGKIVWRFGLSFLFQLDPFPHLIVHYHLISSDDKGILKQDDQLKARRSIPAEWFNRDWYERILAFLHLASEFSDDLLLTVPVGRQDILIDLKPIQFKSQFSYDE